MEWADSPIIGEIQALTLPEPSAAIVCAGSAMELYGLRASTDIDLIVSRRNFEYLKTIGWTEAVRGRSDPLQETVTALSDPSGRFDIWSQWYDPSLPPGQRNVSYRAVKQHAVEHPAGFYVVSPQYLLHLKQGHGRDKDKEDIHLLEALIQ